MAGYFYDFSNFKDNTTLNAIYPKEQMTDMLLNIMPMENYNGQIPLEDHLDDRVFDIKLDNEGNIIVLGKI